MSEFYGKLASKAKGDAAKAVYASLQIYITNAEIKLGRKRNTEDLHKLIDTLEDFVHE